MCQNEFFVGQCDRSETDAVSVVIKYLVGIKTSASSSSQNGDEVFYDGRFAHVWHSRKQIHNLMITDF